MVSKYERYYCLFKYYVMCRSRKIDNYCELYRYVLDGDSAAVTGCCCRAGPASCLGPAVASMTVAGLARCGERGSESSLHVYERAVKLDVAWNGKNYLRTLKPYGCVLCICAHEGTTVGRYTNEIYSSAIVWHYIIVHGYVEIYLYCTST